MSLRSRGVIVRGPRAQLGTDAEKAETAQGAGGCPDGTSCVQHQQQQKPACTSVVNPERGFLPRVQVSTLELRVMAVFITMAASLTGLFAPLYLSKWGTRTVVLEVRRTVFYISFLSQYSNVTRW